MLLADSYLTLFVVKARRERVRPLFDKGLVNQSVYSVGKGFVLLCVSSIACCVYALLAVNFRQLRRLFASCLPLHIEFYINVLFVYSQ